MTPKTLRLVRQTHLYFGVFIAPALLFFAITGALQTFSLHETTRGSTYQPSLFLQTMAQIHKKQTWMLPPPRPKPNESGAGAERKKNVTGEAAPASAVGAKASPTPAPTPKDDAGGPKERSHLPLKIFFLLASVGLVVSTLTGIVMAYKYERGKGLVTALLLAGAVIPFLLLPF